jgi:hypothetical protein
VKAATWQFCPDEDCLYYGWPGLGNLTSNGHPNRAFSIIHFFSSNIEIFFGRGFTTALLSETRRELALANQFLF